MFKRFNMFALALLVLGQTILGPIGISTVAFADELDEPEATPETTSEETVEEVDKTKLQELLAASYDSEKYDESSYASYVDAINKATIVYQSEYSTQEDVNKAVDEIQQAVAALQEKIPEEDEGDDADRELAEVEDDATDGEDGDSEGEPADEQEEGTEEETEENPENDDLTEEENAALQAATEAVEAAEAAGEDLTEELYDNAVALVEALDDIEVFNDSSEKAGLQERIGDLELRMVMAEDEDEYEDEIELDDSHINDFTFKVNGQEYTQSGTIEGVSNEDEFELFINLVDPLKFDELNYGPNTKLKYPLPNGFSNHFTYSDNLGQFSNYGNVKIEGSFVVITLNDNIIDSEGSGLPFDIDKGRFEIDGNFSDSNEQWTQEIDMPKNQKFTVNFKPKDTEGKTIEKDAGEPNKNGEKSDEIEWTVRVNTNLANESASPVFIDTLSSQPSDAGHKFKEDSVSVKEITITPKGVGETSTEEATGITGPTFDNNSENDSDDPQMTITLEVGKAYEIKYTTIPDNPGINENVTYFNTADYDGDDQMNMARVDFGKAIEKEVSSVDAQTHQTEWTITYNGNEQLIKNGTTMSDEWTTKLSEGATQTTAKQKLVGGAGGVTVVGLDSSKYTVNYDDSDQGFNIVFTDDFSDTITIKYKTEPVEDLKGSENFTVINEAKHGQIDTSATTEVKYNTTDLTLNKSVVSNLDYKTKTMKWKITANQAGYDMDAGTTFVDTFTNNNMVLDEDAEFKVTIGNQSATEGEQEDYVLTDKDTDGFEVKLNAATDKEVVIEYTTSFDQIKNVDEDRKQNYHNHVALTKSGLPGSPEHTANINSNSTQKGNGSKDGSYNHETKEFTWTIIFNYNSNTLSNAILKDVLPEEHEITSAILEKGSIKSNGEFEAAETSPANITGSNSFELGLGTIAEPHRLVYTTKMKDDVLPVEGGSDYSTKNKAELFDGTTQNADWEKTVTVKHSNKVLDKKNGKQIDNSDLIEWDFLYNTAQSKLKNVKITDTFANDPDLDVPNQILDEGSLKVYKVTYDANGSMTKKGQELTAGTDYDVSFNTAGATFILDFEELTHGIYVEYESVFIGIKDSPIANELSVLYNDGENKTGASDVPNLNFHYGAFASTSAGEFVIIKTDEVTGEPMEGVKFTLERGNRTITTGTTDEDGILDFGMPFATGTYKLKENTPGGYEPLNNFTFDLEKDGGSYEGKQAVNVTNIKTEDKNNLCPNFTITVNGPIDELGNNPKIELENNKTGQKYDGTLNNNGEVVFDRDDLPAGEYTVTTEFEGNTVELSNDFQVQYNQDDGCGAEVTLLLSCPTFTITVNEGGNPVGENMKITLKKEDDPSKSVTAYTDENGQIKYDQDTLEEGKYTVHNNKDDEIGEVEVTTVPDCEATVDLYEDSIQSCPVFTLTVNDRGNNPEKDTKIVVKDANGDKVEGVDENGNAITEFKTNDKGEIKLPYVIENGTYTVYKVNENGTETRINTFKVTDDSDCKAEVKPRPIVPPVTPPDESCDVFTITVQQDDVIADAGVEIALKDNEGEIASGKTNADGKIEFDDADLPEGSYTVVDKDGNDLGDITVSYEKGECQATVNITTPPAESCEFFTITVKEDGEPVGKDVEIIVQDENGEDIAGGKTDENGQVKTDEDTLPEGDYTIFDEDGEKLGTITVSYDGNCEDEVNIGTPVESCDFFTITVKEDGEPVGKDVEIIVQDENGEDVAGGKTDENGQVKTDEDTLPEGDYTIFDEDGEKLGTITVSYDGNCEDEVNIGTPAESCDFFTVTVKEDGKPVGEDVEVSIQDEDGNEVTTGKTNEAGKIEFNESDLPEGEYTVVDKNGDKVGTITVSYNGNCEDEVDLSPSTTPPGPGGESCDFFTVTVKEDGKPVGADVEITIEDEDGKEVTTGTTNKDGQVEFDEKNLPEGDYTVVDKDGKKLGTITVSYDGTCEDEVKSTTPTPPGGKCEVFTLTVERSNGTPQKEVEIYVRDAEGNLIEDENGDTLFTTDENGKVFFDNVFEAGHYRVYTKHGKLINSFTADTELCEGTVRQRSSGGGGGGGTPPDPDPEDPNEPGEPGDPDPEDPNEPGDPGDPDPEDPNEPGEPGDPDPGDPNEPGEPGDPDPEDPNEPGEPGNPDPEDPNEPGKPGDPDPEDPNEPGKPGEPGQSGDSSQTPGDGKPGTDSNSNVPGGDKLPQTGEELYVYMIALGTVLLAAGGFVLFRRRSVR